jgi:thiol:disulfide interchange protein
VRGADAPTDDVEAGDLPEDVYLKKPHGFWLHDEQDAVREAKRTGRGLLVSFWADWSDECVQMDQQTLRVPAVRAEIFGGYVPLRIDVSEETRLGRNLLERYQVDHLPAIILLDDDGHELDRIGEYVSEEILLARLRAPRTEKR